MTENLSAQPGNLAVLHQKTEARLQEIAAKSRGVLGYSVLDLTSGERFALNENLEFPQASAIKVAILMEVYKQAFEGKCKLTDTRRIRKEDKTGGTGILSELGDGTVELTVQDLSVLMILLSDNTATNLLIDLVENENINATLASLGIQHTKMQRRMMDMAASHRGDENFSTPADAARIMEILFRGEFVNRAVSEGILSVLKKGKPSSLRSGLPNDVPLASKPGSITGVNIEWAVVYLKERPYAVAVMENYGMGDASDAMKQISSVVYEHFSRLAKATPFGALVEKPAK